MAIIKTEGIVIARRDFSEGDRIIWILTPQLGLIQSLAKGVRKILARLNGHLELANQLQLQLYQGKTFYTITEASIKNSFHHLKQDLKKTSLAYHFFELIRIFLPLEQRQRRIYILTSTLLEALNREKVEVSERLIKLFFEIKFLHYTGFAPELRRCVHCGARLTPENNFFSFTKGGILCADCSQQDKGCFLISDDAIKLLRWLSTILPDEIDSLQKLKKTDSRLLAEADQVLTNFLEYLGERKLAGVSFLKRVRRLEK